jgi:hypothetical protein
LPEGLLPDGGRCVTGVLLARGRVARALFWSVADVKNAPVESLRVRVPCAIAARPPAQVGRGEMGPFHG